AHELEEGGSCRSPCPRGHALFSRQARGPPPVHLPLSRTRFRRIRNANGSKTEKSPLRRCCCSGVSSPDASLAVSSSRARCFSAWRDPDGRPARTRTWISAFEARHLLPWATGRAITI